MNKTFEYIGYFTILLTIGFLTLLAYWNFQEYKPIEFTNLPFPTEQQTIMQGGYLTYDVSYCKYNDLIPEISKSFIDGIIYNLPKEFGSTKPLGCNSVKVQVYIPKALPASKYVLHTVYRYQVNPIKTIDVISDTVPFEVIK